MKLLVAALLLISLTTKSVQSTSTQLLLKAHFPEVMKIDTSSGSPRLLANTGGQSGKPQMKVKKSGDVYLVTVTVP